MDMHDLIERSELHDAALVVMMKQDDQVILKFEDVSINHNEMFNVEIILQGIKKIIKDDSVVKLLPMLGDSGSIIAFTRQDNVVEMVMDWTWYQPRRRQTTIYEFHFSNLTMHYHKQQEQGG